MKLSKHKKLSSLVFSLGLILSSSALAQMIPHSSPPSGPPSIPAPMPMLAPVVPLAPVYIPPAPPQPSAGNESAIAALEFQRRETDEKIASVEEEIRALTEELKGLVGNVTLQPGMTPLSMAEMEAQGAKNIIEDSRRHAAEWERMIAAFLKRCEETKFPGRSHILWQSWIDDANASAAQAETKLSFWTAEVERRGELQTKMDGLTAKKDSLESSRLSLTNKVTALQEEDKKVSLAVQETLPEQVAEKKTEIQADSVAEVQPESKKQETVETIVDAKLEEKKSWPAKDTAKELALGDIDPSETMFADKTELADDTAKFKGPETMQELREYEQKEAFKELGVAEREFALFNTLDLSGQAVQMGISFVPSLSVADTALAASRGFAEALGEELSNGASFLDAAKVAAMNAGYTGAISLVGNRLTGGADKWADRVTVLTDVGFSKLSVKQVAEMGAKGISFLVVKTGQAVTSMVVDKNGRNLLQGDQDAMNDTTPNNRSGSPRSGGYGTSVATRPLAQY